MDARPIFHGLNAGYVEELYERYRDDPSAVDPDTRAFFAAWQPSDVAAPETASATQLEPAAVDIQNVVGAARLARLIREFGHRAAKLDPLGSPPPGDPELELATHGLDERDLASLPASVVGPPLSDGAANCLVAIDRLRAAYSGTIGYEEDHITAPAERDWMRDAAETGRFLAGFDAERKRELLERLTEVETFERYLQHAFVGQKRFSIEGCDMVVPMLDSIIRNAASAGTHEVVLGMAHRGRLNVLAHVLGKPYGAILAGFQSGTENDKAPSEHDALGWTGDVKYHLGARRAYREHGIEQMPLTLAPNPSHLEFVNPVVMGRARAAQEQRERRGVPAQNPKAALAIVMHGDAAFPGQGIVAETLNLSRLAGYGIGGTVHIIINNQIGFTTEPNETRSTFYASDLAKGFEIPVVHVNADDVQACIAVARMAFDYIDRFGKDIVIDLVGYRRWGHNEGDEPAFTQPALYRTIGQHPTVREQWARLLIEEQIISPEDAAAMVRAMTERLERARRDLDGDAGDAELEPEPDRDRGTPPMTGVPPERLQALNAALLERPEGWTPQAKLERLLARRRNALADGAVDWGHAEALAFAAILEDGTPIRITGQDTERGTFSHRHMVLHDAETGRRFVPLQALPQARASFAIYNSPLSENATLGFEYGYSMHAPVVLVLWEAQFGDFANGAQVIIDQFIAAGNAKWRQRPGLVLLLPHGYEGQGPEHSSARLERFLQLAAGDNLRVVNPTTAAQYFHLLRRQVALLADDPRPLIVMTPKSLLRHPRAASSLDELAGGRFEPVLGDEDARTRADDITRLVLCSGKVYVDLVTAEQFGAARNLAAVRVEELYPFPETALAGVIEQYARLQEVVWLQEEPRNMGAWSFVAPRLQALLDPSIALRYAGRPEYAAPAEGSFGQHAVEQARIMQAAIAGTGETHPVAGGVSHAQ